MVGEDQERISEGCQTETGTDSARFNDDTDAEGWPDLGAVAYPTIKTTRSLSGAIADYNEK